MTNYELPRHIWDLIKEQVSESEVMEVKNIIGESLVDQTIELRQEVLPRFIMRFHYELIYRHNVFN